MTSWWFRGTGGKNGSVNLTSTGKTRPSFRKTNYNMLKDVLSAMVWNLDYNHIYGSLSAIDTTFPDKPYSKPDCEVGPNFEESVNVMLIRNEVWHKNFHHNAILKNVTLKSIYLMVMHVVLIVNIFDFQSKLST
uniref:Uncharacterized protein n=1 Tax=Glossina palpalis gambiensis TaxID=67801 RepID=A0A1B0BT87_9MUSC